MNYSEELRAQYRKNGVVFPLVALSTLERY